MSCEDRTPQPEVGVLLGGILDVLKKIDGKLDIQTKQLAALNSLPQTLEPVGSQAGNAVASADPGNGVRDSDSNHSGLQRRDAITLSGRGAMEKDDDAAAAVDAEPQDRRLPDSIASTEDRSNGSVDRSRLSLDVLLCSHGLGGAGASTVDVVADMSPPPPDTPASALPQGPRSIAGSESGLDTSYAPWWGMIPISDLPSWYLNHPENTYSPSQEEEARWNALLGDAWRFPYDGRALFSFQKMAISRKRDVDVKESAHIISQLPSFMITDVGICDEQYEAFSTLRTSKFHNTKPHWSVGRTPVGKDSVLPGRTRGFSRFM